MQRSYVYDFIREIKRKVPTGPNPEQSPESPPAMKTSYNPKQAQSLQSPPALKRPYTHNFVGEGPIPVQSPESPPIVKTAYNYNFVREIKRKVPTGPNP
ncbi:hypothetical protein RYX36_020067 [Vicia faba]